MATRKTSDLTEKEEAPKKAASKDQPDMGAYDMRHVSRPIENDDPYDMNGLNEE